MCRRIWLPAWNESLYDELLHLGSHRRVYGRVSYFCFKRFPEFELALRLIFLFFRCSFFSKPFSSVTSQEVPPFIIPFIERFLFLASQLAIMGGFFSMFSWYDIIKNNPKKYNLKSYFMVRYFRLVMISIPMLLLYFVLPHLGELQFDYLLQNFIN